MKWLDYFYQFLIQTFLFIPKEVIQANINIPINETQYYILMIGIWLILIILIWFVLWMFFKFVGMS